MPAQECRKDLPLTEDVKIQQIAERTEGHTGSDNAPVISAAMMLAMREHFSKYLDPKTAEEHAEELKVRSHHIEEEMKKIRPVSKEELDCCKRVAEQFGRPRLAPTEATRIGIT